MFNAVTFTNDWFGYSAPVKSTASYYPEEPEEDEYSNMYGDEEFDPWNWSDEL